MQKVSVLLGAAIIALLALFFVSSRFSVDLLWFSSLGYRDVVTTAWLTMFVVFLLHSHCRRESCCLTDSLR